MGQNCAFGGEDNVAAVQPRHPQNSSHVSVLGVFQSWLVKLNKGQTARPLCGLEIKPINPVLVF